MSNNSKTSFLLLDSSLNTCIILVSYEGQTQSYFFDSMPQNSSPFSHTIASHVEKVFEEMRLSYPEISLKKLHFITCGQGPGSYTGIRASLAFAEGLRCGLNIPLGGICSLKCLKHDDPKTSTWPKVVDARSGGLYVAYQNKKPPFKVPSEQIRDWAKSQPGLLCIDIDTVSKRPELEGLGLSILGGEFCPTLLSEAAINAETSLTRPLSPFYLGKGHSMPHLP
jgi:tRNA threonylcarbamoyl adenosine modification protein YeaZ